MAFYEQIQAKVNFPGIGAGSTDANGRPTGPDPDLASKFVELALKAHTESWYKEVSCKHPDLRAYVSRLTGWVDDTMASSLRSNLLEAWGGHFSDSLGSDGRYLTPRRWIDLPGERRHLLGEEFERAFTVQAQADGLMEEETRNAFNQNIMSGGLLADGPIAFGKQHNRRWLLTEDPGGDVVLHNAYSIPVSTINHDPEGKIRLGTDLRFIDCSRPWDERWSRDYTFGDGV